MRAHVVCFMISYGSGDIFESYADALVNPVNCVGVMGKGLALEFKRRFPENYERYRAACARGEVVPGRMYTTNTGEKQPRWIINFPTKRHWSKPSSDHDVKVGLDSLRETLLDIGAVSVAVPALGCGEGGLDWRIVEPMMLDALRDIPSRIVLFEPRTKGMDLGR